MFEMATRKRVSDREVRRWVKWLRNRGYSGPLAGLKPSFEWVKQLAKELKKDPPTILETQPRDARTIASNLARYERGKGRPRPSKGELETVERYESLLIFEQKVRAHTETVLNLLDTYARQLKVSYEPEDFLTLPKREVLDDKEFDYWLYVKDIVPSIDELIDSQIDSESLVIAPRLEMEPSFAAVKEHHKDTKLGEDISKYKQAVGTYLSAGLKLQRITATVIYPLSLQAPEEAKVFLEGLRELVRVLLAPVRVKFCLEGIETDQGAVLEKLPDQSGKPLQQFIQFVNRYKNKLKDESKNSMQEAQDEGKVILELAERLGKNYEIMKRLYKAIIRGVEEEKLKGMLPLGTKCKFCPLA